VKVFIANFGRENYAWPDCLKRSSIATMNDVRVQPFWEAGDREAYIENRMRLHKTASGKAPTRPVASRWFNLMTTIVESDGDVWFHREKEQLWWTVSLSGAPTFERHQEPVGDKRDVVICHKPCRPWSQTNRKGNRLEWDSLHPKAQEFMFTEGTLQQLRPDNAEYALALIDGADLAPWHGRPDWLAKLARRQKFPGKVFNARERAVWRMADTVKETVAASNGQQVLRTVKDKRLLIPENELMPFLTALLSEQDGKCAISDLPLQYDGDCDDPEMLCSLDRIVCRFINRWKNDAKDEEFRRLIGKLRDDP
jgi:hypothetical protein